jgi:hypothetical protein
MDHFGRYDSDAVLGSVELYPRFQTSCACIIVLYQQLGMALVAALEGRSTVQTDL